MGKYTVYETEKIYTPCTNPKCDGFGHIDGTSFSCGCDGGEVFTGKTKQVPIIKYTNPTDDDITEKNKYYGYIDDVESEISDFKHIRFMMWAAIEEGNYEGGATLWHELDDIIQEIYTKLRKAKDSTRYHVNAHVKYCEEFGETSSKENAKQRFEKRCDEVEEKYKSLKSLLDDDESDKNIYQYFENI